MFDKTFKLPLQIAPEAAIERVGALLRHEGVKFIAADSTISSTKTPFAIFGLERKIYTGKNWVGLNPFVFVSGVQVALVTVGGQHRVDLHVNRTRSLLFALFWPVCVFFATGHMTPSLRISVIGGVAVFAWLVVAEFLGGRLLRGEIARQLSSS